MPIIQLPDGTKVNFAKTPTPQEVDFAIKKITADKSRQQTTADLNAKAPETTTEKIADFTGGKKIAQGLGQALYNSFGGADQTEKTLNDMIDTQSRLLQTIKAKKARGEDTSRLMNALDILDGDIKEHAKNTGKILNQNDITTKEVLGDAVQLGTTLLSVGTVGEGASAMKTGKLSKALPTVIEKTVAKEGTEGIIKGGFKGALKGAKEGAIEGVKFGAGQGLGQGLQDNEDAGGIVKSTIEGSIFGGLFGAGTGLTIGGVSGALKGKKLSDAVIKAQEESGLRPTLDKTIIEKTKVDPTFGAVVDEAKKQGYSEKEINFLSTVNDADKPVLEKMFDMTAKAQSNPRQVERASDLLGDNATNIVKQVQKQNKEAGKAVDATAKALKGQVVDATPIRDKALTLLEDAGVTADAEGKPNWSSSIFSKTPELQAKLMKTLSDLPAGEMDAYDLHKFKKSIDEVVEYGVGGEGLKGKSARILKEIRREADSVLDNNFADYNEANTEFKTTQDFIDKVKLVVGKNVDFSTKQGGQAFGQSFRSAFSNNKSRPRTLALIEELQKIAKVRKLKGSEQNLLDQAIYVNMLEDQFGSQASTGLASEVRKGVESANKAVDLMANPLRGGAKLAVDLYEKSRNINPEAKKEILRKFLK